MEKITFNGRQIPENMKPEEVSAALTVTPIDGRYSKEVAKLSGIASEFALMRDRVEFQILYLIELSKWGVTPKLNDKWKRILKKIFEQFSLADFKEIKEIEAKTNHDVEAVKQFLKNKIIKIRLPYREKFLSFIHFGLTSADVDNTIRTRALFEMKLVVLEQYELILDSLRGIAREYAATPMLGRTHGQPALPTTFGKEIAVFVHRLEGEMRNLRNSNLQVKLGGAIGNMSAHHVAFPEIQWRAFAASFIEHAYGLEYVECTTQIEPYDTHADLFHSFVRMNNILVNFCTDIWQYISDNWVTQKVVATEVGSSAMPQKVNPIKFENAEGNFELAVILFTGLANNLTHSRLQRDLTDSTVVRNVSVPIAWTLIACSSLQAGLKRISPNTKLMNSILMSNWAVLAEPIQTIMRKYGVSDAYNQLKELTRGKEMTQELVMQFIDELSVPKMPKNKLMDLKNELFALSPDTYLGDAEYLAKNC